MKKHTLVALIAAVGMLSLGSAVRAADATAYNDNCAKCHGEDGKGATKMGTKLGARDYTDATVQASFTDAEANKAIKEGLVKEGKTLMKPFSDLSDADVAATVAYLRSLKK